MARTMNQVAINIRFNHQTIVDEVLQFPVDQPGEEVYEEISAKLDEISEQLAEQLGAETDGDEEE